MKIQKGTPGFGILLGVILAALGALIMWIGLWRTLLLAVLFGLGYFLGAVDQKKEFIQNAARRIMPEKKAEVFDYRSEYSRQPEKQAENIKEDGE